MGAVADGAFLGGTSEFFTDERAIALTQRRNRYIAARWGQDPAIFGIELWSEGNLVDDYDRLYAGPIVGWTQRVARGLRTEGARQLLTTHFCGDYLNNLKFSRLNKLPELTYIVSDAYRDEKRTMTEHLQLHEQSLSHFGKPTLITEYGGSWRGSALDELEGDLHSGLWGSFFARQAGTPMLWWHAYVHYACGYGHYLGLARFMADVDPRHEGFEFRPLTVRASTELDAFEAGTSRERLLWVARKRDMKRFPAESDLGKRLVTGATLSLTGLEPGEYEIEWWNTLSGPLETLKQVVAEDGRLALQLPAFRPDIAAKIRQLLKGEVQP